MEVLLQLTWSQGLGAAGDVVGQRCARVVYDGSWDRMVLATSIIGVVAATALASGLSMAALVGSDIPQIRTWMLLTNPALLFINGILAVAYSVAEAQLFTYSTGPMLKGMASLVSPVLILACQQQLARIGILGDVSAKGPFVGWQTSFAFGLLGAMCFLAPTWRRSCPEGVKLDTCLHDVSNSKASGARAIIPFTTMLVCYATWNIVQRFSFVNFRVNELEWLFLDKGIGGGWYLLYLVMQDHVAGRTTDYKKCMQESSRGAPWVALFLLMQFIRIAVSFLVVGSDKSKITVSTASMMLAVARVGAVALVSSAVACIAPNFVSRTAALRRTPGDFVLSMFGYAMVIGSFANWFSTVHTAGDIGPSKLADLSKPADHAVLGLHDSPCYCFDLCRTAAASHEFWSETRGVQIADARSPWISYFAAVYNGSADLPVPFPLHNIDLFYQNSPLWRETFPTAPNPFRPCFKTIGMDTVRPCRQDACSSTWGSGSVGWQVDKEAANVSAGDTSYVATEFSTSDALGLHYSLLASPLSKVSRYPLTLRNNGEWVEVIRANVWDGKVYRSYIEEGVRLDVHRHVSTYGEAPRSHTSFPAGFFNVVAGSGIWLHVESPGLKYTISPRRRVTWDLIVHSGAPGITDREVGMGACPEDRWLRTGWNANRICRCNDSWSYLNCQATQPNQKRVRARWGPWRLPAVAGGASKGPTTLHANSKAQPLQCCTVKLYLHSGPNIKWQEHFVHYVRVSKHDQFDVCAALASVNNTWSGPGFSLASDPKPPVDKDEVGRQAYSIEKPPTHFSFTFVSPPLQEEEDDENAEDHISQSDRLMVALANGACKLYSGADTSRSGIDFVGHWNEPVAPHFMGLLVYFQKWPQWPWNRKADLIATTTPLGDGGISAVDSANAQPQQGACGRLVMDGLCFDYPIPPRCLGTMQGNETCPVLPPSV